MIGETRKKVGVVGVDSGTILVGDPCYWLTDEAYQKLISGECDCSIKYDRGHEGKGFWTTAGWGDGEYDVYVTTDDKTHRVKKIEVIFID